MKAGRTGVVVAMSVATLVARTSGSVHAAPPTITISATSVKVQIVASTLVDAIDGLSRSAGFKVTYEGVRPTAMLFNTEIETPGVPQTLFRLLEGQNLNYAVVFDLSGTKVVSLLILGSAPKSSSGSITTPSGSSRPQSFSPPRGTRNDLPPVDDDPNDPPPDAPPAPEASPSPTPTPVRGPVTPPNGQPFGPRPFAGPFGPRPIVTPSP